MPTVEQILRVKAAHKAISELLASVIAERKASIRAQMERDPEIVAIAEAARVRRSTDPHMRGGE
jgi:hypothetical protein